VVAIVCQAQASLKGEDQQASKIQLSNRANQFCVEQFHKNLEEPGVQI
jgi:hypothetical protein